MSDNLRHFLIALAAAAAPGLGVVIVGHILAPPRKRDGAA